MGSGNMKITGTFCMVAIVMLIASGMVFARETPLAGRIDELLDKIGDGKACEDFIKEKIRQNKLDSNTEIPLVSLMHNGKVVSLYARDTNQNVFTPDKEITICLYVKDKSNYPSRIEGTLYYDFKGKQTTKALFEPRIINALDIPTKARTLAYAFSWNGKDGDFDIARATNFYIDIEVSKSNSRSKIIESYPFTTIPKTIESKELKFKVFAKALVSLSVSNETLKKYNIYAQQYYGFRPPLVGGKLSETADAVACEVIIQSSEVTIPYPVPKAGTERKTILRLDPAGSVKDILNIRYCRPYREKKDGNFVVLDSIHGYFHNTEFKSGQGGVIIGGYEPMINDPAFKWDRVISIKPILVPVGDERLVPVFGQTASDQAVHFAKTSNNDCHATTTTYELKKIKVDPKTFRPTTRIDGTDVISEVSNKYTTRDGKTRVAVRLALANPISEGQLSICNPFVGKQPSVDRNIAMTVFVRAEPVSSEGIPLGNKPGSTTG